MNGQELLEKFPKVTELTRQWYKGQVLKASSIAESPEYKQYLEEFAVKDELLVTVLNENPRALFDVFDENKVFIFIIFTPVFKI